MFFGSSIVKKQIVAVTGFVMILFVMAHLAGNLLIFAGPAAFNGYAHQWHRLGPLLLIARVLLGGVFLVHIVYIYLLVIDNIKARGGVKRYAVEKSVGQRTLAEKVMAWSGLYIILFVIFHILDFAAADINGLRSYINGTSYGLYGIVFNSFRDPAHALLYVVAMYFLGMHLAHGAQSMVQTCGFRPAWQTVIKRGSDYFAVIVALGFSTIPVYVHYISH